MGTKAYDTLRRKMVSPKPDTSAGPLKKGHANKTEPSDVAEEKTSYQPWQTLDPKNMREQSKQFFIRDPANNQRHSLPPKNTTEVHRVLPRAPSGPMYSKTSKLRMEYSSPQPQNVRQPDS